MRQAVATVSALALAAGTVATLTPAVAGASLPDRHVHAGRGTDGGAVVSPQDRAVDGIAAVVNGEVISIGEVHRALGLLRQPRLAPLAGGCGALPAGMSPEPAPTTAPPPGELPADGGAAEGEELPSGERRADDGRAAGLPPSELGGEADVPPAEIDVDQVLQCLIDGVLVFREVRRFPSLAVTEEAVQEAFEELVASFPSRQEFDAALEANHLAPPQVRRDLEQRLLVAAYIDTRFRATAQFSEEDVRRLWEEELAPEMRERGIEVPELDAVAEEYVRPILREREVNRRIQSWIRDLRRRAEIRRHYPPDGDT